METSLRNHQEKMYLRSELFQWFVMVYRTIIGVNFHVFIICYCWLCHFPFFLKTLSVITKVLFLVRCAVVLLPAQWPRWSTQISTHITHYRRREVRNSIYRYRKIHIDYRSKFSYRFISSVSIIYGNTTEIISNTNQFKYQPMLS